MYILYLPYIIVVELGLTVILVQRFTHQENTVTAKLLLLLLLGGAT